MEVYEITGFKTGLDHAGVNFLDPIDAFESLKNGYVFRQELKSRFGFSQFGNRLTDGTRVMGIFEDIQPNGTKELLVCTQKFLYHYTAGANPFIQVPFAGVGAPVDFGIVNPEDYVSGTSYYTKTGSRRFIICGKGINGIFYYDGVNVIPFTQANDLDYRDPPGGVLSQATYVKWFGERLNFFNPVIGATTYSQAILYSGIRDNTGKGDQFNVVGSGLLSADTEEKINGVEILGDIIVLSLQRSYWTIEKTRDAFNPYLIKKVPSVLGTDAPFSSVCFHNLVRSLGNTGFIQTDARNSLRFDNKLPFFAMDEIDPEHFALTYGGIDRFTDQVFFSYRTKDSQLADITQDATIVYNYNENTWATYDWKFSVFGEGDEGTNLTMDEIDETIDPSWYSWDTTEEVWDKIGITNAKNKTLAGDNNGFVYELDTDYEDNVKAITGITNAAQAVISVADCPFAIGDIIVIEDVVGMLSPTGKSINGTFCTVMAVGAGSVTVDVLTTDFTPWISGGVIAQLIHFEAEFAPFNPYRNQGKKVFVSHVDVLLSSDSGPVILKAFADENDYPLKECVLEPTTLTKPREWITMELDHEADFISFALETYSYKSQIVITSVRVYCKPGSMISG